LFAHVNAAAQRTLAANGYDLVRVADQGCCGALHAHAGLLDEARALARANVVAFGRAPEALVAVTAAGCGAMLTSYGELLAHDPLAGAARALAARVRDVTQLLQDTGPRRGGPLAARVVYDPPCHLLHAQRVADAPRAVLDAIPQMEVAAHEEAELCCGSAGIFSLLQPAMSRAVLARKVAAVRAADPDAVVTGNPGCAMQIGAGLRAAGSRAAVAHPVELLDRSYAAAGYYE
jgi:glycolate oxidase iron-sulfur subunit